MTRIRIIKCNEVHELPVSNGSQSAVIPVDGKFHKIDPALLGALTDSSVEFEIEATPKKAKAKAKAKAKPKKAATTKRRAAKRERAPAGAAVGLGGSAAAPTT